MVKYFVFFLLMMIAGSAYAQDSIAPLQDSTRRPVVARPRITRPVRQVQDSTPLISRSLGLKDSIGFSFSYPFAKDSMYYGQHPFFRFTNPVRYGVSIKQWQGKEAVFYTMIALLLLFALIRNGFYRYLQDLFRTYFQTTVKQRQIKEQLLQSPLPSLLLNLFFLLSIGMFLALLLRYFGLATDFNFWILFLYCVLGLIAVYGVKFLSLKLLGWIFQVSNAIESYIFIVFTTNKIIGIMLLPFLVVLAFTYGAINQVTMTLSIVLVLALLVYRFFLSFTTIRQQVHISFFHFLLYLCAFEVAPVLLINKLLFRFLGETP